MWTTVQHINISECLIGAKSCSKLFVIPKQAKIPMSETGEWVGRPRNTVKNTMHAIDKDERYAFCIGWEVLESQLAESQV